MQERKCWARALGGRTEWVDDRHAASSRCGRLECLLVVCGHRQRSHASHWRCTSSQRRSTHGPHHQGNHSLDEFLCNQTKRKGTPSHSERREPLLLYGRSGVLRTCCKTSRGPTAPCRDRLVREAPRGRWPPRDTLATPSAGAVLRTVSQTAAAAGTSAPMKRSGRERGPPSTVQQPRARSPRTSSVRSLRPSSHSRGPRGLRGGGGSPRASSPRRTPSVAAGPAACRTDGEPRYAQGACSE